MSKTIVRVERDYKGDMKCVVVKQSDCIIRCDIVHGETPKEALMRKAFVLQKELERIEKLTELLGDGFDELEKMTKES